MELFSGELKLVMDKSVALPTIKVLLVEDNPPDAILLEEYLNYSTQHSFDITTATTLADSRNYMDNMDVVILDLGLPDSQGIETLLSMVKLFPMTPIIILTGLDDNNLGVEAVKSGAQDFLAKNNLNTSTLEKAIVHAIERKHLLVKLDQLKEQEHIMATHDVLTGLPNRFELMNKMNDIITHANRSNEQFSLLFIDLDHFKTINDTQGHHTGDEVLKRVAERLKNSLRESDVIARIGGDEFICVLRDVRNILNISGITSSLINLINEPIILKEHEYHIGASIGIATYPKDGNSTTELLKSADTAMYVSKDQGRNQYVFSDPSFNQKVKQNFELEQELRQAIINKELIVYFQPIIETSSLDLVSCEALIRWDHPKKGILAPGVFLPIAIKSDLIVQIGEYVLKSVASCLKSWKERSFQKIRIAVNISPSHFEKSDFVDRFTEIFREHGIANEMKMIDIEITEDALLNESLSLQTHFDRLKEIGTGICIDDFGTGYSSLKYLSNYPLTTLKIDRSFILNALTSEKDRSIIKSILALAEQLNLKVVAEGIETAEHAEMLTNLDCTMMQGYYYSYPISQSDFETYMDNFHSTAIYASQNPSNKNRPKLKVLNH